MNNPQSQNIQNQLYLISQDIKIKQSLNHPMTVLLLLISALIAQSFSSSIVNPLSEIHFQGTYQSSNVVPTYLTQLPPLGPCTPCNYSFDIGPLSTLFTIRTKQSELFSFDLTHENTASFVLLTRTLSFKGSGSSPSKPNSPIQITIQLHSFPIDGMLYSYTVKIPQLSLQLQHTEHRNQYLLLFLSTGFAVIMLIIFPFQANKIQKFLVQMHKRTCFISMYLYCSLIILISALQGTFTIIYIYYSPSLLIKILCYPTLGGNFLIAIIFATCALAVVQKQLDRFLPHNSGYKCLIVGLAIIGLIVYPFVLTVIEKEMWFFYVYLGGLVGQFCLSWQWAMRPCWHFVKEFTIGIVYLAILSDQYPIANFCEHSIFQLTILILCLTVVIAVGWLSMRKVTHKEDIESMFEMKYEKKTEKTQQNAKKLEEEPPIDDTKARSDLELEREHQQIQQ